jgi:hypothetical protein
VILNGVVLLCILVVARRIQTYEPPSPLPPGRLLARDAPDEHRGPQESGGDDSAPRMLGAAQTFEVGSLRPLFVTILTPEPPPPPTPTKTPLPLRIEQVMAVYELVMLDPPKMVMLRHRKSGALVRWRVGERRPLEMGNRRLDVRLRRVDGLEFFAEFAAPPAQRHKVRLFPEIDAPSWR